MRRPLCPRQHRDAGRRLTTSAAATTNGRRRRGRTRSIPPSLCRPSSTQRLRSRRSCSATSSTAGVTSSATTCCAVWCTAAAAKHGEAFTSPTCSAPAASPASTATGSSHAQSREACARNGWRPQSGRRPRRNYLTPTCCATSWRSCGQRSPRRAPLIRNAWRPSPTSSANSESCSTIVLLVEGFASTMVEDRRQLQPMRLQLSIQNLWQAHPLHRRQQ